MACITPKCAKLKHCHPMGLSQTGSNGPTDIEWICSKKHEIRKIATSRHNQILIRRLQGAKTQQVLIDKKTVVGQRGSITHWVVTGKDIVSTMSKVIFYCLTSSMTLKKPAVLCFCAYEHMPIFLSKTYDPATTCRLNPG